MVYVGATRSKKLIERLTAEGYGEIVQPYEYPPRRHPWALDNAAFAAWKAGTGFDSSGFLSVVQRACAPDFVVVPDVVAGGAASLALSLAWEPLLRPYGHPLALVVQDGMNANDVARAISGGKFRYLFVGGTLEWKLKTGESWVELAHKHGLKCHVGRVGTGKRVRWAKRIGADSIDSCLPLWSDDNLRRFMDALAPSAQYDMFTEDM